MVGRLLGMSPDELNSTPPTLPESEGAPAPDRDGQRIAIAGGEGQIWFVWNGGYKCWVPDPDTYESTFASWDGIVSLDRAEVDAIASGAHLSYGAMTVQVGAGEKVYLVTNGTKNWIASPEVMTYCNFRPPTTDTPAILVESIPMGILIDYVEG